MANKTTGSGQWTNMGNVTTNPLGSYSDSKTYNFLDMVSYEGGSYICLENETIGVRPSPGESTDRWFCSSVPGEATPDFKNLVTETKEAAKTAKEKATDAEVSAKNSNDSAMAASSAATLAIDAAKNAENSKDVVAGYKRAAEKAANDAASSKESVDTKIAGLDETFANKTNSSMQSINDAADAKAEEIKTEINTTKQQAINTITNQQDASVNIVKTEGEKIITKVGNDAKTVADDRATVEEATQTVLNNAQEVAQNTQTVASNTEKAAVSAEGAKTSADNAAQSAKSVEDASKQIEQNKKDIDSLKEELSKIPEEKKILDLTSYSKAGTISNSGSFSESGSKQVKVDIPISNIASEYSEYFEDQPILNVKSDPNKIYQARIWLEISGSAGYEAIPSKSTWLNSIREIIPIKNIASAFLQITRIDGRDIADKNDAVQAISVDLEKLWETGDISYDNELSRKAFEIEAYYNSNMTRTSFSGIVFPVYPGETLIVDGIKLSTAYCRLDENFQLIDAYKLSNHEKTGSVAYIKDSIEINSYSDKISRNFIIPENVRYIAISKSALFEDSLYYINSRPTNAEYDSHSISALKQHYPQLKNFKGQYDRNNDTCQMISSKCDPLLINEANVKYRPYLEGNSGDFWIFEDFKCKRFANTIARRGDIVWFDGTALRALKNPYAHEGNDTAPNAHYDIVIVGGGAGGVGAAYALCNSGLRVCLIEKENNLGGTHTSGGVFSQIASPIGDWYKSIAEDAYNCAAMRFSGNKEFLSDEEETSFNKLWRGSKHNTNSKDIGNLNIYSPFYLYQKYHDDLTAGGIEIRYNRKFSSCKELDGVVISATFKNLISGGEETVTANYFIDSTGDCYLARYGKTLDVDYFIGSDPKDKYEETAVKTLPENPHYDINTLDQIYLYGNYNSAFNINSDGELFTAESPYAEKDNDLPNIEGVTKGQNSAGSIPYYNHTEVPPHSINPSYYPGVCSYVSPDYYCGITNEEFVKNGYDITRVLAENKAKAHYKLNKKTTSTFFIETMPMLGIREGYRMKCDYMVTQKDVETTITSENYNEKHIVVLSSWYVDIHKNTTVDTDSVQCTYMNGIPYEAMIPCTQKNVLVACRGYGASHIALAAIRLTKTMLSLGYAAGKALLQARKNWINDVRDIDITILQNDIEISKQIKEIEDFILSKK